MKKILILIFLFILFIGGCAKKEKAPVVEFWTTEIEADRMAVQNDLAREFESRNPPVKVKVVAVGEDRMNEKILAARAARTLPSVIRVGLEYTKGYLDSGIIDTAAATDVINGIGREIFFEGALRLLALPDGKSYAGVPIDGWAQGIWYRKDWFEEKKLAPPADWPAILAAAEAFHNPKDGKYGIIVGTDPAQPYTQQVFEHLALSAGVRIFDIDGNVSINEERFNEVVAFYKKLARCGPPGYNYWRQARQTYLTGSSAMIFYSPYIIDDIAGLVKQDELPVENLAKNTGFVSVIEGAAGEKASYGQVVSLAVVRGAEVEPAKKWIAFLLSDGYERWLDMTPGGKTPVLKNAVQKWSQNDIFSHYEEGLAENLAEGLEKIERWGYRDGESFPLISGIYGRKLIPDMVNRVLEEKIAPEEAAKYIEERLEQIQ